MKSYSNTYIFIFSSVMVISVAALLSIVALQLKPIQDRNIRTEKIQNILASVHIESNTKNADSLYNKYITESYVVDAEGNFITGSKAFDIDLKKEAAKIEEIKKLQGQLVERRVSPFKKFMATIISSKEINKEQVQVEIQNIKREIRLPVYLCSKQEKSYYIFALRGKGLWGPIWGYLALQDDLNNVYGAIFDHKGETPGLGAEIKEDWFEKAFEGKQIFDTDMNFRPIVVAKGEVDPDDPYSVDAITGGTITSKGLEAMLTDFMSGYLPFIESKRK